VGCCSPSPRSPRCKNCPHGAGGSDEWSGRMSGGHDENGGLLSHGRHLLFQRIAVHETGSTPSASTPPNGRARKESRGLYRICAGAYRAPRSATHEADRVTTWRALHSEEANNYRRWAGNDFKPRTIRSSRSERDPVAHGLEALELKVSSHQRGPSATLTYQPHETERESARLPRSSWEHA
jgi:hypothetical protein